MLLSICMMVKNEENNLNRCLKSLDNIRRNIKSELIIIDTGSEDNTVEIARKYTDNVYFHKWNNNFSEMRNITISYAKGKWIFIIDADEELENDSLIIDFFKNLNLYQEYNTVCIRVRNFISIKNRNSYTELLSNRFFRNDGKFRYEGAVHNQAIYKNPVLKINSTLLHYGYDNQDIELMEKKFKRTSTILKQELKKEPNNIYYRYQLSASYGMYNRWDDALREAQKAYCLIKNFNKQEKDKYFYIYSHMIMIYKKIEMYEKIIKLTKEALSIRKNDIDSHFFAADAYTSLEDYKQARYYYKNYIELVSDYEKGSIIEGLNVDMKIETLGFKDKAIFNLISLLYKTNRYDEVIEYRYMIPKNEHIEKLIYYVVNSFILTNKIEEFKSYYYNKSIKLKDIIINSIEIILQGLNYDQKIKIMKVFSKEDDIYSKFNKLRLHFEKKIELSRNYKKEYEKELIDNYKIYYADIFYYYLKDNKDINSSVYWLKQINNNELSYVINYLDKIHNDTYIVLLETIYDLVIESIKDLKIKIELQKYLLIKYKDKLNEEYKKLFNEYLINGYEYISRIYNKEILENESMLTEINNSEYKFYIYMNMSKKVDVLTATRLLRKALKLYPQMKEGISLIAQELKKSEEKREKTKEEYIDEMEKRIKAYLANGEIEKAKKALLEYEKLLKN